MSLIWPYRLLRAMVPQLQWETTSSDPGFLWVVSHNKSTEFTEEILLTLVSQSGSRGSSLSLLKTIQYNKKDDNSYTNNYHNKNSILVH